MAFDPTEFAVVQGYDCGIEAGILQHALSARFGDSQAVDDFDLKTFSPARLAEVARLNKLAVFLADARKDMPQTLGSLAGWLDVTRLRSFALNRQCLAVGRMIAEQLDGARIAHMQFKGPLQQARLFGSPTMKPASDIDILVAPTDLHRARDVLSGAGFRPDGTGPASWWTIFLGEQHFRRSKTDPVIDLHHRLQQPGSPSPRHVGELLDRAEPFVFEGFTTQVPTLPDTCLIAAISLVKALFGHEPCAGYAVDLRAALDAIGADQFAGLAGLAQRHGLLQTLSLATRAVDALFTPLSGRSWAIGTNPLPMIPPDHLRALIITPWAADTVWPRRRSVLWALCGRDPARFGLEFGRIAVSETYRRALEAGLGPQITKETP